MKLDEETVADLVADKLLRDDGLMAGLRERLHQRLDALLMVTPEVAEELTKTDRRTLNGIVKPKRIGQRTTRFLLSDLEHLIK